MNSATFSTMRKAMGLTTRDVAVAMGVAERTAERWEAANTPPADAADWMGAKFRAFAEQVYIGVEAVEAAAEAGEDAALFRHRDEAECVARTGMGRAEHAALLGHILVASEIEELPTIIVDAP